MWSRQSTAEFDAHHGEDNRRLLRALVDERAPGLLAYEDGEPVGWVSVGGRKEFPRLNRSPITKPVDDLAVWSIVCFYIHRGRRGQGIATGLLDAAVAFAKANNAPAVEGYPVDKPSPSNAEAFWGVRPMFARAGFDEIARRSPTRPVMRRYL